MPPKNIALPKNHIFFLLSRWAVGLNVKALTLLPVALLTLSYACRNLSGAFFSMPMAEEEYSGTCACLLNCVRSWRERDRLRRHAEFLRGGDRFKRRTFTFGFGTGNEKTEVRLKPEFDTVLVWRKESEGDKATWHEIDLGDVKNVESKGKASLLLSSKTGDVLLELEAADANVRDAWVEALDALLEDLRLNPQARMAQKSVKDRVKEQAQKQRHLAKRTIEMQQHKKDAEARKARYLKETGGMKYTAVAMANRL